MSPIKLGKAARPGPLSILSGVVEGIDEYGRAAGAPAAARVGRAVVAPITSFVGNAVQPIQEGVRSVGDLPTLGRAAAQTFSGQNQAANATLKQLQASRTARVQQSAQWWQSAPSQVAGAIGLNSPASAANTPAIAASPINAPGLAKLGSAAKVATVVEGGAMPAAKVAATVASGTFKAAKAALGGAAKAAKNPKVAGGFGKAVSQLTIGGVTSIVVGEAIKNVVAIPVLKATGLYAGSAPPPAAAGPAGAAGGLPGSMTKDALPSQPALWDQLLFNGDMNRRFGNPGGLNYQRMINQNETQRRGQDINLQRTREQVGGQVQSAKIGADSRIKVADLNSSRQLQGTRDTNQTRERIAAGDQTTRIRVADTQAISSNYRADRSLDSAKVNAGARVQSADLTSARQLQGRQLQYGEGGSVDRTNVSKEKIAGLQYGQGGTVDRTNASKERINTQSNQTKYAIADVTSGRRLEGVKDTNQTRAKIADVTSARKLQGQTYAADASYAGKVDSAKIAAIGGVQRESVRQDGGVKIASIRASGQVGAAQANASGRVGAAQAMAGAKMYESDTRARIADLSNIAKTAVESDRERTKRQQAYNSAAGAAFASANKASTDVLKMLLG